MATELNLKSSASGNNRIRISWDDFKTNDMRKGASTSFAVIIFVSWLGLGLIAVAMSSGWPLLLCVMILLGAIFWYQNGSYTVSNAVDFSPETITHQGRDFPTNRVTRFEYGLKSALTGVQPARGKNGDAETDPMLIRMWIDDAESFTISENNWQNQVNHNIRDTLAKALDSVRKDQAKQNHEAIHGKMGDFGMPDL